MTVMNFRFCVRVRLFQWELFSGGICGPRALILGNRLSSSLMMVIRMVQQNNTDDNFGHCDDDGDATHMPWAMGIVGKRNILRQNQHFGFSYILHPPTSYIFLSLVTFWLEIFVFSTHGFPLFLNYAIVYGHGFWYWVTDCLEILVQIVIDTHGWTAAPCIHLKLAVACQIILFHNLEG